MNIDKEHKGEDIYIVYMSESPVVEKKYLKCRAHVMSFFKPSKKAHITFALKPTLLIDVSSSGGTAKGKNYSEWLEEFVLPRVHEILKKPKKG